MIAKIHSRLSFLKFGRNDITLSWFIKCGFGVVILIAKGREQVFLIDFSQYLAHFSPGAAPRTPFLWRQRHLKVTPLPKRLAIRGSGVTLSKVTSEHYSAIQTRSSVLEGYLQDGHNEPKKPPSAYWKACVQKILLF